MRWGWEPANKETIEHNLPENCILQQEQGYWQLSQDHSLECLEAWVNRVRCVVSKEMRLRTQYPSSFSRMMLHISENSLFLSESSGLRKMSKGISSNFTKFQNVPQFYNIITRHSMISFNNIIRASDTILDRSLMLSEYGQL